MAAATASVICRFVASSSSRLGKVPSGLTVRGTPAVFTTRSASLMTSYSLPATYFTSLPMMGVPSAMSRHLPLATSGPLTSTSATVPASLRWNSSCASTPPIFPPPISAIFFSMR